MLGPEGWHNGERSVEVIFSIAVVIVYIVHANWGLLDPRRLTLFSGCAARHACLANMMEMVTYKKDCR